MKTALGILSLSLPWELRSPLLQKQFGYAIHASSHIGLAWVFPDQLGLGAGSSIGHLTVCNGLSLLRLEAHASIGRGN